MHDPGALRALLEARAELTARTRAFFMARGVLEVDTPTLGAGGLSDPHLEPFRARLAFDGGAGRDLFLQTSPELFMKRLLAAGSGDVYQLAHAFRNGEAGPRHNPEFTILEWYRVGWDHHQLMGEVAALLHELTGAPEPEQVEYAQLFQDTCGLDPLTEAPAALAEHARRLGVDVPRGLPADDPDPWLDLIFSCRIEPQLGRERPVFVTAWPAHRAALAAPNPEDPRVADRFELFYQGLELANGFRELTDPVEQRRRFQVLDAGRVQEGAPSLPADERFLAALGEVPACAGVAVGFDRVVMVARGCPSLAGAMAFPLDQL